MLSRRSPAQLRETHVRHSAFVESKEDKKTEAEMRRTVVVLDTKQSPTRLGAYMKRYVEVIKFRKTAKTMVEGE